MMCTFLSEHILCSSLSPGCVENKILGTYRYSNEGSNAFIFGVFNATNLKFQDMSKRRNLV
jgi:hypothetical protein